MSFTCDCTCYEAGEENAAADLERARAIAVELEQRNARALELLAATSPQTAEVLEAIAVLEGPGA